MGNCVSNSPPEQQKQQRPKCNKNLKTNSKLINRSPTSSIHYIHAKKKKIMPDASAQGRLLLQSTRRDLIHRSPAAVLPMELQNNNLGLGFGDFRQAHHGSGMSSVFDTRRDGGDILKQQQVIDLSNAVATTTSCKPQQKSDGDHHHHHHHRDRLSDSDHPIIPPRPDQNMIGLLDSVSAAALNHGSADEDPIASNTHDSISTAKDIDSARSDRQSSAKSCPPRKIASSSVPKNEPGAGIAGPAAAKLSKRTDSRRRSTTSHSNSGSPAINHPAGRNNPANHGAVDASSKPLPDSSMSDGTEITRPRGGSIRQEMKDRRRQTENHHRSPSSAEDTAAGSVNSTEPNGRRAMNRRISISRQGNSRSVTSSSRSHNHIATQTAAGAAAADIGSGRQQQGSKGGRNVKIKSRDGNRTVVIHYVKDPSPAPKSAAAKDQVKVNDDENPTEGQVREFEAAAATAGDDSILQGVRDVNSAMKEIDGDEQGIRRRYRSSSASSSPSSVDSASMNTSLESVCFIANDGKMTAASSTCSAAAHLHHYCSSPRCAANNPNYSASTAVAAAARSAAMSRTRSIAKANSSLLSSPSPPSKLRMPLPCLTTDPSTEATPSAAIAVDHEPPQDVTVSTIHEADASAGHENTANAADKIGEEQEECSSESEKTHVSSSKMMDSSAETGPSGVESSEEPFTVHINDTVGWSPAASSMDIGGTFINHKLNLVDRPQLCGSSSGAEWISGDGSGAKDNDRGTAEPNWRRRPVAMQRQHSSSSRRRRSEEEVVEREDVRLRRVEEDALQARKDAGEWMLDCAMGEMLQKLNPDGGPKVKVIVEAFETVLATVAGSTPPPLN